MPTRKPRTQLLADVARTGDRLATLTTLRDRLAADLDGTRDAREVAALALRLTDVLAQIDQQPATKQVSRADEIAERRAARRRTRTPNKTRAARPG
jgi:hypothetical protein